MISIYKIVDNTNGNIYVGSTVDMSKRKWTHKNIKDCSSKQIIDNDDYEFIVIEECEDSVRSEREQYYIDTLDNVINERDARVADYTGYHAKRYQADKERHKEYDKNFRIKHHEKILEQEQIWRDNNKDEIKRKNKSWNLRNKDKMKRHSDYIKSWGGYPQANNNLMKIDITLFD